MSFNGTQKVVPLKQKVTTQKKKMAQIYERYGNKNVQIDLSKSVIKSRNAATGGAGAQGQHQTVQNRTSRERKQGGGQHPTISVERLGGT